LEQLEREGRIRGHAGTATDEGSENEAGRAIPSVASGGQFVVATSFHEAYQAGAAFLNT
jgi:hypothetical protein